MGTNELTEPLISATAQQGTMKGREVNGSGAGTSHHSQVMIQDEEGEDTDDDFDEHKALGPPGVAQEEKGKMMIEMKAQLRLAGPMVVVNLLQFLILVVSLMFVGHLGELRLSGAAIGSSFCSVTGNCVLVGLASGLETLCGQAYGAQHYSMLGVYLQRALVVLYMAAIPMALAWLHMEAILMAIGQDPAISALAGEYAFWLLPGLVALPGLQATIRFLQSQSVTFPMALATSVALLLHIPANWLLIHHWGLGFKGAPMAVSLAYWVNLAVLLLYIRISAVCQRTWSGFSWAALHGLWQFLELAIPAATMTCLEYWSFEILTLLSGLMPNPQLQMSTLSICLQTCVLNYMIPYGLSCAASTRVANALGAGQPYEARRAAVVAGAMSALQASLVATCLWLLRSKVGFLYTSVEEVVQSVAGLVPFLVVSGLFDALQAVFSGVARGSGWQQTAVYINLGAYYVVGLPLAATLGFHFHLAGKGLWIGLTCGIFTQMVCLLLVIIFTDWEATAAAAIARVTSISDLPEAALPLLKGDDMLLQ